MNHPRINIDETWSLKVADDSDDFNRLFDLIEQGVKNVGEEDVDRDFLYSTAMQFFTGPMSERIFLVLYKDMYPVGVLLGLKVATHPVYSKTGVCIEQLWWVDPQYRGSKNAVQLIDAFEEWARQIGVKRVVMGHFHDEVGSKVKKYYERSGFKLFETCYMKELK